MSSQQSQGSSPGSYWLTKNESEAPNGLLCALRPSSPPMEPEDQPTDPLAAAIRHNSCTLLLSRLPEELLLEIMDRLDPVSIFCLRRTSRTFLRLFGSQSLKDLHEKTGFFEPGPWTAQELPRGEDWFAMARLLNRDAYCPPCEAGFVHTTFLQMQYMHCAGCKLDHTSTLFSAAQRLEDRSKRVCIGHEGHVRLCEHKTVKVGELCRWTRLVPRLTCYHQSHVPAHHVGRRPKGMRVFPTLDVGMDGPGQATLSHTAHLDLSGHGQEVITAEVFRAHIRELRKGAAGYIAPEPAPGILPELRAFDPTRCGCLLYPGMQPHGGACEEHRVSRTVFSRDSEGSNTIDISFETCEYGARCLKVTHKRTIHYRTSMRLRELPTEPPERVRGGPCDAQWKLARARDASAGPISYNWYAALEPASYGLALDRESYGLTWCNEPRCLNYHGYLRGREIRGQRVNVRCADGCERVRRFYRFRGRCTGIPVAMKTNGAFAMARGAMWADEEWRPGMAEGEDAADPALCAIL
ncbi:hypothetical protein VUR80DRAFT_9345 [Thermomyces stellatus]